MAQIVKSSLPPSIGQHNLYSELRPQREFTEAAEACVDRTGNLPHLPSIFPDYASPIVRTSPEGRELVMACCWGMPSPPFALKGRQIDQGVANIRNLHSPHWRRWLGIEITHEDEFVAGDNFRDIFDCPLNERQIDMGHLDGENFFKYPTIPVLLNLPRI